MSILYILGFLLLCYLMFGPGGGIAFWTILKWPIAILLGLATLIDFPIYGINPILPFIVVTGLAFVKLDDTPIWVMELLNLFILIAVSLGVFYVFILVFGDPVTY